MKTTMYLHGSKEDNTDLGLELGLKGEALSHFVYAMYEVKLDVMVNPKTGEVRCTHLNDVKLTQHVEV